ncbi:hypothetical protein [Microbacterium sp. NPDC057650]|uniref:hypothetical protein n=1 Tax=unclassified Microbacterium TaxID=2609290 RepID=UPI00366F619A
MDIRDDSPQVGPADVDEDALRERGVALVELITELGVRLDDSSAEDAPRGGWRVLRRYATGAAVIGAPAEPEGRAWRVAHVGAHPESVVMVQPDPMPLRPSRVERRQGLELRWPTVMTSSPSRDDFVVDIVNTGSARWESDADGFHVVGVFTEPGATRFSFGWVSSSQHKAVPLDPGEYARVGVSINPGAWDNLEAGTYDLHAVLVSLGLRTLHPLTVELTADLLSRKRAARSHTSPVNRRRMLDQQIEQARAQISASQSLDLVFHAVMTANTDDDAITGISRALSVDEQCAASIYHSPLQALSPHSERMGRHLAHLIAERDRVHCPGSPYPFGRT